MAKFDFDQLSDRAKLGLRIMRPEIGEDWVMYTEQERLQPQIARFAAALGKQSISGQVDRQLTYSGRVKVTVTRDADVRTVELLARQVGLSKSALEIQVKQAVPKSSP